MRPRHQTVFTAETITVEGGLIAPAMLARIANLLAERQKPEDYAVPKGLALRDEIARAFRIGEALYTDFKTIPAPSIAATTRFVETFLADVLGFTGITRPAPKILNDRAFPITFEALQGRVPVTVVPPADALDRISETLSPDRRRSAASAVQDYLNIPDQGQTTGYWGLACNGAHLRLARRNASLTRPALIEADLDAIFTTGNLADFALLYLLLHASRFGAAPAGAPPAGQADAAPNEAILESWRNAGAREGIAARDRLRQGVESALEHLGAGFLADPANAELRSALQTGGPHSGGPHSGAASLPDFFAQLLRLVYRLIFLLTAEDRDLLHPPGTTPAIRKLYAEAYSLSRLRDRAIRRAAWDAHHDAWEGLCISFRSLAQGEPRLGLPALDGMFARDSLPLLANQRLSNRALMEAIFRLAWLRDPGAGLAPVNWRDMETEELGSVYESLLELAPRLSDDGRALIFAQGAEQKGNERKTTGSYYTPDSLVQTLLDSTLDPVLHRIEAEADDPAAALLSLTVIDPACGSGHFLLAAARRIATRLARARSGGAAPAEAYRHALREVAASCIFGLDRNPMAVELTKVALWIETVDPGKPLGFLDANIKCGDALLGIFDLETLRQGIPDAAYKPLAGDDRETAKHYAKRNKTELIGQGSLDFARGGGVQPIAPLARGHAALRALPDDSPEEIEQKRRAFAVAKADPRNWSLQIAADLYTAAFLLAKTGDLPSSREAGMIPTSDHVFRALSGAQPPPQLVGRAQDAAAFARAFHWPLEFPDVMASGGFDIVLGNPPWERIKLQEQEFFASRAPEIAEAANKAERSALIGELSKAAPGTRDRALFEAFETAKRVAEAASLFARLPAEENGRFPLTGRGDVNTYALFAELFSSLVSNRGRAGVIVPTGIATDATTAPFFAALIDGKRLARLIDFENRAGIFPAIDSRIKFSLLTIGRDVPQAEFAFFLTDTAQLAEPKRRFTLSPAEIARINPNTKTAPVFRARADAALTAKIYARVPVLIDETKGNAGNPWGLSFARLFDMSNDSGLFGTAADLATSGFTRDGADWSNGAARYVPLYEAKMIHQFDHRWATYDGADSRDGTLGEKQNPAFEPAPRYWVPETEVTHRLHLKNWYRGWLMGWRDITNATNERTVIATAFPRAGVGNKIPLMFPSANPPEIAALVGNLSTLVLDFAARQKVGGTTLNFFILYQFPVLSPDAYTEADLAFIIPRVLELTYTSHAMRTFALDLGYNGPPFAWNDDRRAHLRAELDAWYARAYGLTRDDLRYILDPADALGPAYPSETFRVLKKNDIARFGHYRTARLTLAAWDAQDAKLSGIELAGAICS